MEPETTDIVDALHTNRSRNEAITTDDTTSSNLPNEGSDISTSKISFDTYERTKKLGITNSDIPIKEQERCVNEEDRKPPITCPEITLQESETKIEEINRPTDSIVSEGERRSRAEKDRGLGVTDDDIVLDNAEAATDETAEKLTSSGLLSVKSDVKYDDSSTVASTQIIRCPDCLPEEESNFLRFCLLIQKVGPRAVRHRFDQEFPPDQLAGLIQKHKTTLTDLRNSRLITQVQWNLIFPVGSGPVSSSFDVTLMLCLFRHLTKISPKSGFYDALPPPSDDSLGADLARIKYYRNKIAHYLEQDRKLDSSEFIIVWETVSKAVSRIGGPQYEQECSSLLTTNLDSSHMDFYREVLMRQSEIRQDVDNVQKVQQEEITKIKLQQEEMAKVKKAQQEDIKNLKESQHKQMTDFEKRYRKMLDKLETKSKEPIPKYEQEEITKIKQQQEEMAKVTKAQQEDIKNVKESQHKQMTDFEKRYRKMLYKDPIPKHERQTINFLIQQWESRDHFFAETRAATELMNTITSKNVLTVTGSPGSGKSFTTEHVLLQMKRKGYDVIPVTNVSDMVRHFSEGSRQIFYIDDLLGRYNVSKYDIEDWERNSTRLKVMFNCCKCIFTCRLHIYQDSMFKILHLEGHSVINLSGNHKLSSEEKINVGKQYLDETVLNRLSKNTIESIICFPLLCSLFNTHANKSIVFFKKPETYLKTELDEMKLRPDKLAYACIALCVLFNNNVPNKIFSASNQISEVVKDVFSELEINIMTPKKTLKLQFESLVDSFFKRSPTGYQSIHDLLFDILCSHVGTEMPECFINHADSKLISERAVLQSILDGKKFVEQHYMHWICQRNVFRSLVEDNSDTDDITKEFFRERTIFHSRGLPMDDYNGVLGEWNPVMAVDYPEYCNSMIILSTGYEQIFFVRMKSDFNNGKLVDVFESYQMMYEAYRLKLMSFFIKEKINLNVVDNDGQTAIFICSRNGYYDILEKLCISKGDVNLCTKYEVSPLLLVLTYKNERCAKLLLNFGARVKKCDKTGRSPLHEASRHGFTSILQDLINRGADINQCDVHGKSPLYVASHYNQIASVRLLLGLGADVNKSDEHGVTPLYEATLYGFTDIVRALCEKGADVNQSDLIGMTPLHFASRCNYKSCADILIRFGAVENLKHKESTICKLFWHDRPK